jgi:hypothetical protein
VIAVGLKFITDISIERESFKEREREGERERERERRTRKNNYCNRQCRTLYSRKHLELILEK